MNLCSPLIRTSPQVGIWKMPTCGPSDILFLMGNCQYSLSKSEIAINWMLIRILVGNSGATGSKNG